MGLLLGNSNNNKNVTETRNRFIDIFAIYSYNFIYFNYCISKHKTNTSRDVSMKRLSLNHPAFNDNRKEIKISKTQISKAVFTEKYISFKHL